MDTRFTEPVALDSERAASLFMYAIGTPLFEIATGVATPDIELTSFVVSMRQTQDELTATLSWNYELYGADQPKPRRPVAARVNGDLVFIAEIDAVNDYRLSTGERSLSITARSRDASPAWRESPRTTPDYPQGTRLDVIARDVARSLPLNDSEILLPVIGVTTAMSSTQMGDISAWQMLETLLLPGGLRPATDALGRLRTWSADIMRASDIVLPEERLLSVTGGRSRPPITRLQVKWLDPTLTRVEQQDRVLANANITAGFFQLKQQQDVWFSEDHTQRARDTRLVVMQSANSGLLHVCSEDYELVGAVGGEGDLHGKIVLRTAVWVPLLAIDAVYEFVRASFIPDDVYAYGWGRTFPIGRVIQAVSEAIILVIMMSIGTGVYEVWGIPYDYVHGRNTTEAYDLNAPPGIDKVQVVESDLLMSEEHAQAVAQREFLYAVFSANSYGLTMVDDLRVQVGDIIELPDATRVFVTGLQRDLTHGAAAVLEVEGFQVPAVS